MLKERARAAASGGRMTPADRGDRAPHWAGVALAFFLCLAAWPAAADEDDASPACASVYDRQACSCAARTLASLASAGPADMAATVAAGAVPMVSRSVQLPRRDLAELIQWCMAPGAQTPAD